MARVCRHEKSNHRHPFNSPLAIPIQACTYSASSNPFRSGATYMSNAVSAHINHERTKPRVGWVVSIGGKGGGSEGDQSVKRLRTRSKTPSHIPSVKSATGLRF